LQTYIMHRKGKEEIDGDQATHTPMARRKKKGKETEYPEKRKRIGASWPFARP